MVTDSITAVPGLHQLPNAPKAALLVPHHRSELGLRCLFLRTRQQRAVEAAV